MPTLDASSPAGVYINTAATTAVVTASFTPPTGSVVVAKVYAGDGAATITGVTGLTFTSRFNVGASGQSRIALFTAIGAGAAVTVTASFATSSQARTLVVEVWTAAQLAGTPASGTLLRTTNPSAPSATLTTTGTGSVLTFMMTDYAGTTTAPTYRSSAVETGYNGGGSGPGTLRTAYQQAAAAGSQTYGATAPTMNWWLGAIEIQAAAGAVATPKRRIGKRVY